MLYHHIKHHLFMKVFCPFPFDQCRLQTIHQNTDIKLNDRVLDLNARGSEFKPLQTQYLSLLHLTFTVFGPGYSLASKIVSRTSTHRCWTGILEESRWTLIETNMQPPILRGLSQKLLSNLSFTIRLIQQTNSQ